MELAVLEMVTALVAAEVVAVLTAALVLLASCTL
jgi:hypothetical protein